MVSAIPQSGLLGRRSETAMLDELLEAVRAGESRALAIRGDPGVGKTALLEYVVEHAMGCRVARAAGVQAEMELAFAGLHQLCAPMLDRLERLPGPHPPRARAHPPAVRRMAPPPETAPGCPRTATHRAPHARGDGHGRVRAARRAGAGGQRGDRSQAQRR